VRKAVFILFNIILHHPNVHISPVKLRAFFVQKFMFIYTYIILYNIFGNAVNKIGL